MATFSYADGILTITTSMLVMKFEEGAVTYVEDVVTDEVLIDSYPTEDVSSFYGFNGFTVYKADTDGYANRQGKNANVVYAVVNANQVTMSYGPLWDSEQWVGGTIVYTISTEDSGEITIQATGWENQVSWPCVPTGFSLPIMHFDKADSSVIFGTTEVLRGDSAINTDYFQFWKTMNTGVPRFCPAMVVAKGDNSCLSVWSENDKWLPEDAAYVRHYATYDHIYMLSTQDPKQADIDDKTIISSTWRFGIYPTWLDAVKRWRVRFEELNTDASPLWENRAEWVRNVHAMVGWRLGATSSYYDDLAALADPETVIYFLWNAGNYVLMGDHTQSVNPLPTAAEQSLLNSHGWPLMFYHGWNLFENYTQANITIASFAPEGYKFTPDYVGADDEEFATQTSDERLLDWEAYWEDMSVISGNGDLGNRAIHPGYSEFKDYFVRNVTGRCAVYNAKGFFFDTFGGYQITYDIARYKTAGIEVVDGEDYRTGERTSMIALVTANSDVVAMPEAVNDALIPYIIWSWEGYANHHSQANNHPPCNHPLRTALLGSYLWGRDQGIEYLSVPGDNPYDHVGNALTGCLPILATAPMTNKVEESVLAWTQSKVAMFCGLRMFNDLPDAWATGAYAYFRTKYGVYVRFQDLSGGGYEYVAEHPVDGDISIWSIDGDGVVTSSWDEIQWEYKNFSCRAKATMIAQGA